MGTVTWQTPTAVGTAISTGLNSLADGGRAISSAIDNATGLYPYMDIEVSLAAQGSARDSGAYVEVYVVPALDGTNFSYGGTAVTPSQAHWAGNITFDAATDARRAALVGVQVPPSEVKILVQNETGQALAASGNTVTYRRYGVVT